jgi:WD40 repeat protein
MLKDHRDIVKSLHFAPDGSLNLLSASRDGTVKFWDLNETLSNRTIDHNKNWLWYWGYGYGVSHHFQRYFSYIVAVSFIGGGNWSVGFFGSNPVYLTLIPYQGSCGHDHMVVEFTTTYATVLITTNIVWVRIQNMTYCITQTLHWVKRYEIFTHLLLQSSVW